MNTTLQLIKDSNYHYIISGGGSKEQRVNKSKKSLFTTESVGFTVLEVSKNKIVTANFYTVTDSIRNPYNATLLDFSKIPPQFLEDTSIQQEDPFAKYKDTVHRAANPRLQTVNGLKKVFMGQNYRAEWSTKVGMKVFNLKKEKGGLTIVSFGGDPQSTSLRLKDRTGKEWTLRTVNKNFTKSLPQAFQGSIVKPTITEYNSSSFPYGSVVVPALLKTLGLQTPNPELFYVPDDPALSFYRKVFADKVCTLEEREPSNDGSNTISTAKVFGKVTDENDHRPIQDIVLKTRLLDMVIGDFDRHFDQWKWSKEDTGKGKLYIPISKGRDLAFFNGEGLQLKLFTGRALPFLKGFKKTMHDVDWLGYGARDFDRFFLNDLDAKEWKDNIQFVQTRLNDSSISKAIRGLPPEIFPIHGEKIISTIISRRELLSQKGMEYYRFISRKVNIVGSNDREYFKVESDPQGLHIRVYARESRNDTSFVMYDRVFDKATTKEIRLFGLNGNDLFYIDSNATSKIKLRIIGGKGSDTFDLKGRVESLLYDIKSDDNFIKNSSHAKNRFSVNVPVNDNTITNFQYNKTRYPRIFAQYNSDAGASMGIGFSKTTQGFRNLPYASDQRFSAAYFFEGAYQLHYKGEFNHVTRTLDILLQLNSTNPGLHNFFGLGNETKSVSANESRYHLAKYKTLEAQILFRKRVFSIFHLMVGPYFYQYRADAHKNANNILTNPQSIGLDPASVFGIKRYAGIKGIMHIDNRNNEVFPTRGIHWDNEVSFARGIGNGSKNYGYYTANLAAYLSRTNPAKLIAILRVGGGKILTDNFAYFQALPIGGNNLPGFRQNRFVGKSTLYSGIEFKLKLFDINSYTLSGPFGLSASADIGRVWLENEQSKKYHTAFGGGFYFVPFNLFVISATGAYSKVDKVINFSLGAKINLKY